MAAVSLPSVQTPFSNTMCTPVVSADPVYRGHYLKAFFAKPKSADSSGTNITLIDLSDVSVKCSTPYRLPRISPPCESPSIPGEYGDGEERVFGRFGYEDVIRMPELGPSISRALINPHCELAQRYSDATHPSTTPISRSLSPAKSTKSIHWALGNEKNSLFDHNGRSRAQGPFSREFTIRCGPPPNWMSMKFGRSKTMVQ